MEELKKILSLELLHAMPRVFSQLNKNPFSKTYGSFDRKFWHYKILDFPCGMQQELVLPLAYVWKTNFPGNTFYQLPRLEAYLKGVFQYHQKSSHKDGSLDDYFPYERAYGATAYSLAALTEAYLLCGFKNNPQIIAGFEKSGRFLVQYRESGKLTNHLAIASLALINLFLITGDQTWQEKSNRLIREISEIQNSEGWFDEYGGCDLGYQTVSIEFLARYYRKNPTSLLKTILEKNIKFLYHFLHPDGSFGGEYGSRNTFNFYPGGFAVLSTEIKEAGTILKYFFKGIEKKTCNYLVDDGVFGHMLSSYITVLRCDSFQINDYEQGSDQNKIQINDFKNCGLFSVRCGPFSLFGSMNKGGVYQIFKDDQLINSDTGLLIKNAHNDIYIQNKNNTARGNIDESVIVIKGQFKKYNSKILSPFHMLGLRGLCFLFGRIKGYSNFIRFVMQKLIIYDKSQVNIKFERKIAISPASISVSDQVVNQQSSPIREIYRTTDCVNMHVVTSDSFQQTNLLAWEEIKDVSGKKEINISKKYQ